MLYRLHKMLSNQQDSKAKSLEAKHIALIFVYDLNIGITLKQDIKIPKH